MKCIICERRPAVNGNGWCANCTAKIEADRKRKRPEEPVKFLVYRANVVGLFPNGQGTLKPRLLRRDASKLPKGKTINLDHYCHGFTREQVKRFKKTVLRLAGA